MIHYQITLNNAFTIKSFYDRVVDCVSNFDCLVPETNEVFAKPQAFTG